MMRHTLYTQFTRRATTCPRSSLRPQVRSRRNQTSGPSKPDPVSEPKNTPSQPPQSSPHPSPPSKTPPTNASTSSSASPPNTTAVRSRSFRQIILDGPIGRVGRSYARIQERRPYATQLWSTVVVYLCGDLSAQLMFPPDKKESPREDSQSESAEDKAAATSGGTYDPYRTMRHLVVGAGSSIPSYNWFMFLHNHFNFTSKFLSILTKVVVQQSVFTPVFNTYFFSVHSLLSGATFEETWERLKKALPVSITNSCKLWPAVTAFSFMYIPAQFRNIFSGVIAVGWQTYLSWLNQKAAREVEAAEQALAAAESSTMTLSSALTAKA